MNTASLAFLGFSLGAALLYNLFRSVAWRQATLFLANAVFLYTFASNVQGFLPLLGFVLLGFLSLRIIQEKWADWAYVPLLAFVILVFVWLKKYAFLPSDSLLRFTYVTIGLSYILFRVLHLMIDAHSNLLPAEISLVSYLNYTLNFMTLVSGPIQRYENFSATQLAPVRSPLTIVMAGEGIHRIVVGFFKVTVLSWLLAMVHTSTLEQFFKQSFFKPTVFTAVILAVSYPLYLYFNFSGYTDIVIGVGRFFRYVLPENFDRPLFSDNFMEFWGRRWHITLSTWLKTYVFNPLLLVSMRKVSSPVLEPFLAVPALLFTFFLVGVWHGQTSEFLMFGLLQGLGVAVNQLYQILLARRLGQKKFRAFASNSLYVAVSRGLTFTYFTLTLFTFCSSWSQMRGIGKSLGISGILSATLIIFVGSTVVLTLLELVRNLAMNYEWNGVPALLSRYTLTVFDTSLAVVSVVVAVILNSPAPEIVYKAF